MAGGSLIKNYIFVFLLGITAFLGSLFILFPLFPLVFINRSVWRRVVDQIIGLWLCLPVALMEYFHGVRFRVTGDRMNSTDKAVIIMNHRTRLDWLFLWSALYRMDNWLLTTEKIILKAPLRKILGAGWAMECNGFIFLERSLEKDAAVLSKSARYLASTGNFYQVLIFPEGTDLCPNTLVKSDSYAESKNLPLYRNVLHPRTNGLTHLIRELKQNGGVDYIYDFTIAYPSEIVQTEIDFAKTGACPSRVDFHCHRYRLDDILSSARDGSGENNGDPEMKLRRWCEQLWQRKELALSRYYGSNNNNNNKEEEGLPLEKVLVDEGIAGDRLRSSDAGNYEISTLGKTVLLMALAYWLTSVSFWLYALLSFWWLKYFAIAGIVMFKSIEFMHGGIERFEIALWEREQRRSD